MAAKILFITGTDTDVGKTVYSAVMACLLREWGTNVAALKPIGAGSRGDAIALRKAARSGLSLDEVNPWHFKAALAPTLSARMQRKKVRLAQVVRHVRAVASRFDVVIVEGAGGLLSPMGEDFDSRDLITALGAYVFVVAPNRLGAVNQVRLVLDALPGPARKSAQVVLIDPPKATLASRTNVALLQRYIPKDRLHAFPWMKKPLSAEWNATLKRQIPRIKRNVMP